MQITEKEKILLKVRDIYRGLLEGSPEDPDLNASMAMAELELADVRKVQGSVADGLMYASSAVTRMESVTAGSPDDIRHMRELCDTEAAVAGYYLMAGDANAALAYSRRTLELNSELRDRSDSSPATSQAIVRSHRQIGDALLAIGDFPAAVSELQLSLAGEQAAHLADPNDMSVNYYLWATYRRLARATELNGDRKAALDLAHNALGIMDDLREMSPADVGYNRNTAVSNLLVGQILVRQNQPQQALQHFQRALALSEYVLGSNSEYVESKIDVARSKGDLGHALLLSGNDAQGRARLRESLEMYAELLKADTGNAELKRDYAETAIWQATALERVNKPESDGYRKLGETLWSELSSNGQLSAADKTIASSIPKLES